MVRQDAARALGTIGDPRAIDPLFEALKYSSGIEVALQALEKFGEPAIKPLVQAMTLWTIDINIQLAAKKIVEKFGALAADSLIAALKVNPNKDIVELLLKIGDPRVLEPLIAALEMNSWHSQTRDLAAEALGQLGDPRAVNPLLIARRHSLDGTGDEISVEEALVNIGAPAVIPLFDALVGNPPWNKLNDEDAHYFRRYAARALEQIGAPAVESLFVAVKEGIRIRVDSRDRRLFLSATEWLEFAQKALLKITDPRAAEVFIASLQDNSPAVRGFAADALGKFKQPAVFDALVVALQDSIDIVRKNAAGSLGELNDPRAVEPLIAALKDSSPDVRIAAIGPLVFFRDDRAIEPLFAAMKDVDPEVRRYAAECLRQGEYQPWEDPAFWVATENWEKCIEIGGPAVEPLIIALKSDPKIAIAATKALGKIGDSRAVEPLTRLLNDPQEKVRTAAQNALAKLS
jgi:HEAT repeat protein